MPVGALLAVVADASIADDAIDAFVTEFQASFAASAAESAADTGPEPEFVEAGGRRLRYLKVGEAEGTPVLFIHGFGGDLNNWLFNQPALAETHTTYALDLPGHGGSAKEVGAGDVGAMTAAVCDFMAAMGIAKAHLVGHSLGGAISLDLALNHPELVASVTAVAPAALGPEISMEYIDGFIAHEPGAQAQVGAGDAGLRPGPGHQRDGRGRAQVQTPGRRRRGAEHGGLGLLRRRAARAWS